MKIFSLDELLVYLENTSDESWLVDKCRSKDHQQHCVISHIFNFGGGDELDSKGNTKGGYAVAMFEEVYATTFMIYPVNDGKDPRYQQSTPKARCIAYIQALRDGKEKTTLDCWKEMDEFIKKEKELAI